MAWMLYNDYKCDVSYTSIFDLDLCWPLSSRSSLIKWRIANYFSIILDKFDDDQLNSSGDIWCFVFFSRKAISTRKRKVLDSEKLESEWELLVHPECRYRILLKFFAWLQPSWRYVKKFDFQVSGRWKENLGKKDELVFKEKHWIRNLFAFLDYLWQSPRSVVPKSS